MTKNTDKVDLQSAAKFLKILDPSTDNFSFQVFFPHKKDATAEDRKGSPPKILHGSLKQHGKTLIDFNKRGYGVYVTVNATDLAGRKKENIVAIRTVFQEDDDGAGDPLPLPPSMVIATSPGKFHRYFLLDKPVVLDAADPSLEEVYHAAMACMIARHGSDEAVKDISRVLRVPGFFNTKGTLDKPFRVEFAEDPTGARYSKKQIKKAFPRPKNSVQKTEGPAGEYSNHEAAVQAIMQMEEYYPALRYLSGYYARQGFTGEAITRRLVKIMKKTRKHNKDKIVGKELEIWNERVNISIPDLVRTIVAKVGPEAAKKKKDVEQFFGDPDEENCLTKIQKKIAEIIEPEETDPDFPFATAKDMFAPAKMKKSYTNTIGHEEWLYQDIVIKKLITTVIAESGGGKTTFFFNEVCPHMAKNGYEVQYIDLDSPASDHKKMLEYSEKHGFDHIHPDSNSLDAEWIIERMINGIRRNVSFDGQVFIFDTLKKFCDMMDKNSIKTFYKLMRKATTLGATIICLGHSNKKRDALGALIHEGTGDVKSDTDNLLYFEIMNEEEENMVISTMVERKRGAKLRGEFKGLTFDILKSDRSVAIRKEYLEPITGNIKIRVTDDDIVNAGQKFLATQANGVIKKDLVQAIRDSLGVGTTRITETLSLRSFEKGSDKDIHYTKKMLVYVKGDKTTRLYENKAYEPKLPTAGGKAAMNSKTETGTVTRSGTGTGKGKERFDKKAR